MLVLRDGAKCYSCGHKPMNWSERRAKNKSTLDNRLEIQHVLPVSKGGSNCLHNLIFLCHPCHTALAKGKVYGGTGKA